MDLSLAGPQENTDSHYVLGLVNHDSDQPLHLAPSNLAKCVLRFIGVIHVVIYALLNTNDSHPVVPKDVQRGIDSAYARSFNPFSTSVVY